MISRHPHQSETESAGEGEWPVNETHTFKTMVTQHSAVKQKGMCTCVLMIARRVLLKSGERRVAIRTLLESSYARIEDSSSMGT